MTQVPRPDPDRDKVRALLWDACELEHQLMLQYLFAAFTLKKFSDESCTEAQLEAVRRWTSTIMVVARQEMEHLALANGMLAAIGEDPFFARENIPRQTRYFHEGSRSPGDGGADDPCREDREGPTPLDIPFLWERFNQRTMKRFVCAESPGWKHVHGTKMYPEWCFAREGANEEGPVGGRGAGLELSRSHVDALRAPDNGAFGEVPVHPGTIPELYCHIGTLLQNHPEWFVGVPDRQVFIPVEYQISVIPITDPVSALAAIEQIVEEGEGIGEPPGYDSHFARFWKVHQELLDMQADAEARGKPFHPALRVARDPVPHRDWLPYTREVSHLLNYAYVTLVYVLTSLYRNYALGTRPPYLTQALQNVAFGPFMTMIIRPVAEVLVHLRIREGSDETAGPVFHLSDEEEAVIWPRPRTQAGLGPVPGPPGEPRTDEERERLCAELDDINFILYRLDTLWRRTGRLAGVAGEDASHDAAGEPANDAGSVRLRAALVKDERLEWARGQLEYVRESTGAMANNLRRIYQVGQLPQFTIPVDWPS